MKKSLSIFTILTLLLTNSACSFSQTRSTITQTAFIFDTAVTITIYDQNKIDIIDEVFDYCRVYESKYSKMIASSEVSKLNNSNGEPVLVSDELILMLEESVKISELSDGLFDITIYPLSELWGFSSLSNVPSQSEIDEVLSRISYKNIQIDGNYVTLLNDAKIDLGAIAKGQIADLVRDHLVNNKVKEAIISIGGNIVTLGLKNGDSPWTIGLQKPFSTQNDVILAVSFDEKNIVTSGPYERNFYYEDVLYHHILNPKTGYPADMDLYSVSIICDNAMLSDALSTTCYILGYEKSLELLKHYNGVHAVFITNEYEILTTDGIEEEIAITIY